MIYQGQEVAFDQGRDPRRAPVSWNTPENGTFVRHVQRLAHARARFPAFGTQTVKTIHRTDGVYGYVRPWLDENALVLVNFGATPRTVTVNPLPHVVMSSTGSVPYHDVFADTSATFPGAFTVTLPAYETVVYVTSGDPDFDVPPLPTLPYGAVYTGIEGQGHAGGDLPHGVVLNQNHPNPFNPSTTIRYGLPASGKVRLAVYDLLGRVVETLVDGVRPAGWHEVSFGGGTLSSGTYLYRLETPNRVITQTMVLLK